VKGKYLCSVFYGAPIDGPIYREERRMSAPPNASKGGDNVCYPGTSVPSKTMRGAPSIILLRFEKIIDLDLIGERIKPLSLRKLATEFREKRRESLATLIEELVEKRTTSSAYWRICVSACK